MTLIFVLIFVIVVVVAMWMLMGKEFHGGVEKDLTKYPRSKSEAFVVRILEELIGGPLPTVNPPWLKWRGKSLELDGYNEGQKIALEFSGPLHTKWTPSRESYSRYISRVIKDEVKVRMCKKRGVDLIVVDASLPREHIRAYLESRLSDLGRRPTPTRYIPAQVGVPYRNPQLEEELGIAGEFSAVSKIK